MSPRVAAALVASALGWGFAAVGVRVAFEAGVSTFTVVDVRLLTAMVAVSVFVALQGRRPTAQAWKHGAIIGIPRIGLAPVLFIGSLQHISAGVEGLFITLIPVATSLLAWVLLREHLTRTQMLGLTLGLLGAGLIIVGGESGLGGGEGDILAGGVLALGGVFFGSLSGVLSRKYAPRHDTADLAMPMFVTGAMFAVAVSWIFGSPDLGELDIPLWLLLIALGLGSTLLPFVGTLYASRYASAARVAVVGYVAPMISVVGGILLLDEVLTVGIVIGGGLALTGALLVSLGRRPAWLRAAVRPSAS
jgi:drug/metabolite transporter (DMT)-like permease